MNKVPVGATIAGAWRFAFVRFVPVLGVLWLPMLLTWLPGFLLQSRMHELSLRIAARDFSAVPQLWTIMLPFYLAVFLLMSMQMVGVAKLALGLRAPSWFFFSLGKPVWRLFGNLLLFFVIASLGLLAAVIGGVLFGALTRMIARLADFPALTATLTVVSTVFALFLLGLWVLLIVRLSFLLTPVVATEEPGMALGRAWVLSKGNFWRLLAILLAFLLPFIVLELVLLFAFMLRGIPFPPPHPTPLQQAIFQVAMQQRQTELAAGFYHYWYISFPLLLVAMVLFFGVAAAAHCLSYRALVSDEIAGG